MLRMNFLTLIWVKEGKCISLLNHVGLNCQKIMRILLSCEQRGKSSVMICLLNFNKILPKELNLCS